MKKLIIVFLGGGIFLFCLLFFRSQDIHSGSENCRHLKVNLSEGDPPSLHPQIGMDTRGRILGKALFEGLMRIDEQGSSTLAAADSVEIDAQGTQYRFTIRPHLWSNGQSVTAYHFENAWKQAIHPQSPCARADLFYCIKNAKKVKSGVLTVEELGIKALNDRTLVIELENPAPYFLQLITHPIFSPLYYEEKEPTIFNGPFKVGKWERGSVLELNKNRSYWDEKNVRLDKVSIFMVPDTHTELSLFEKNVLDIVGDCFDSFALDVLPMAMKNPGFKKQEISRIYWIYFNTSNFPFQSKKIRQAFSYALDRACLTKDFLIGDTPCSTILPRTLSLLPESTQIEAKKLFEEGLQELGLTPETFPPIILSYCTYGSQKSLSELFKEHLQTTLGIKVKIQSYEWNVLAENMIQGQFQLASCLRNAVYEDPLYFLEIFKEKNNSYNFSRWENESYKDLLNFATKAIGIQQRINFLRQAEELLQEEMPVIPVYMENCKYITQEGVKGYFINRSGYVDFKNIYFD